MDSDLVVMLNEGLISKKEAKMVQERRNLKKPGKYEPCEVTGLQKTPTEIALENTRINNEKLKALYKQEKTDNERMKALLNETCDDLERIRKEKEYWEKVARFGMKSRMIYLLNKLEEDICTSCKERDENSDDWCPYGCYNYNCFSNNYQQLIKNAIAEEIEEFS